MRNEALYPEQYLDSLLDRGWGVRAAFRGGFRALQSGLDPDLVMTEIWSGQARELAILPVPLLKDVAHADERVEILELARTLHDDRQYAAAVPLLAAQTDGIVADAYSAVQGFYGASGGKALASKLRSIDADESSAARGLQKLVAIYSAPRASAPMPELARNGILHGWTMDYGTQTVAAKYWSVLAHVLHVLYYFPELSDILDPSSTSRDDIDIAWPRNGRSNHTA